MGRVIACGILLAFLFRMIILYAPSISIVNAHLAGTSIETPVVIDDYAHHYSTAPGPDLNIPMVKDGEENLKEQLLKCIKYPLPLLLFTFCLGLIFAAGSIPAWSIVGIRRRPSSRLYLSVSILRI